MNRLMQMVANAVHAPYQAFMDQFTPGNLDTKRAQAWQDYGWVENPTFAHFYSIYRRNGIGHAGIVRTIEKTWGSYPEILEREDTHDRTQWEKDLDRMLKRVRFWDRLREVDKRNRVGKYAALIFIFNDGRKPWDPIDPGGVPGGWDALAKIIPAYEEQLKPTKWESDRSSVRYGEPVMYNFNESALGDSDRRDPGKTFEVHHSRVFVWAEGAGDGSIYGEPANEPGLNSLVTFEKIMGAGGEGFWKIARAPMKLNADPEANLNDLANALGVELEDLGEEMNKIVKRFYSGADQNLFLQGIDSENMQIHLPDPKEFAIICLQDYSASISCPLPILMGHQTGERASTQDSGEWAETNMSRRTTFVMPNIQEIIRYLMDVRAIPRGPEDFHIEWDDLTAPSFDDKLVNAETMSKINKNSSGTGIEAPFSGRQIVEASGLEYDDEGDDENGPTDPTA